MILCDVFFLCTTASKAICWRPNFQSSPTDSQMRSLIYICRLPKINCYRDTYYNLYYETLFATMCLLYYLALAAKKAGEARAHENESHQINGDGRALTTALPLLFEAEWMRQHTTNSMNQSMHRRHMATQCICWHPIVLSVGLRWSLRKKFILCS